MSFHARLDPAFSVPGNGATGYPIFTNDNAPVPGLVSGVGIFHLDEFPPAAVHDDHEGFYVINGSGRARVGDEEFAIAAGSSFVAPAGVLHAIRKDRECGELRIFWFHFPR
jgi:mannose-6-phosphate isomerase-like protein (cupin superfamily)